MYLMFKSGASVTYTSQCGIENMSRARQGHLGCTLRGGPWTSPPQPHWRFSSAGQGLLLYDRVGAIGIEDKRGFGLTTLRAAKLWEKFRSTYDVASVIAPCRLAVHKAEARLLTLIKEQNNI